MIHEKDVSVPPHSAYKTKREAATGGCASHSLVKKGEFVIQLHKSTVQMFRTSQQWYESGGGSTCEVQSLTVKVKIQGLTLTVVHVNILLKVLF
jgi:hypothetical protein